MGIQLRCLRWLLSSGAAAFPIRNSPEMLQFITYHNVNYNFFLSILTLIPCSSGRADFAFLALNVRAFQENGSYHCKAIESMG